MKDIFATCNAFTMASPFTDLYRLYQMKIARFNTDVNLKLPTVLFKCGQNITLKCFKSFELSTVLQFKRLIIPFGYDHCKKLSLDFYTSTKSWTGNSCIFTVVRLYIFQWTNSSRFDAVFAKWLLSAAQIMELVTWISVALNLVFLSKISRSTLPEHFK